MDRLEDGVRERLLIVARTPVRRQVLRRLGLGDADLRRLVRRRHLQHHHGHYIDGRLDELFASTACAQAAYPGSVVSHFTAARLAGLELWTDRARSSTPPIDATWLTRPPTATRNLRRRDLVVRRAGLTRDDISRYRWLLVTAAARTVVDLARELPFREAIVTVDHALRTATTAAELRAVADRLEHWPGIVQARAVIDFGDARSESALESISRAAFRPAGLPAPVLQAQFFDGAAWMPERVDFWWPQFRTIAEADGLAKYEADTLQERRRRIRRAHRRDQRLSDLGVELVHFGWEDALAPRSDLTARLRSAFARGTARRSAIPTWRVDPPRSAHVA